MTPETIAAPAAVVVHSLAQAVAALAAAAETGRPIVLLSAVDGGLSAGAGWWREVIAAARDSVPAARSRSLLDCGEDVGAAQAALRAGVEAIVFTGRSEVAGRLADIAGQRGSRVLSERPEAALDLGDDFFAPPETLRRRVLEMLRGGGGKSAPTRREMPQNDGSG